MSQSCSPNNALLQQSTIKSHVNNTPTNKVSKTFWALQLTLHRLLVLYISRIQDRMKFALLWPHKTFYRHNFKIQKLVGSETIDSTSQNKSPIGQEKFILKLIVILLQQREPCTPQTHVSQQNQLKLKRAIVFFKNCFVIKT